MKNILTYASAFFLFGLPAQAQEIDIKIPCPIPAEYQAGVDVNGKAVVPADVEGGLQPLAYPIQIPVEVDALKFLSMEEEDEISDFVEVEGNVAYLSLHEDGRIEYNGKDMTDQISKSCGEASATSDAPVAAADTAPAPVSAPQEAGQQAPQPVASDAPVEGGQIDGQYP